MSFQTYTMEFLAIQFCFIYVCFQSSPISDIIFVTLTHRSVYQWKVYEYCLFVAICFEVQRPSQQCLCGGLYERKYIPCT